MSSHRRLAGRSWLPSASEVVIESVIDDLTSRSATAVVEDLHTR